MFFFFGFSVFGFYPPLPPIPPPPAPSPPKGPHLIFFGWVKLCFLFCLLFFCFVFFVVLLLTPTTPPQNPRRGFLGRPPHLVGFFFWGLPFTCYNFFPPHPFFGLVRPPGGRVGNPRPPFFLRWGGFTGVVDQFLQTFFCGLPPPAPTPPNATRVVYPKH